MTVDRPSDRRRSPRVEILDRLHGHSVTLDVPVTVREINLGGMAIELDRALPDGRVHDFKLTLGDGATVDVRGRVVHCRPDSSSDGPRFLVGIEFVDEPSTGDREGEVIDRFS